jgi:putative transposase
MSRTARVAPGGLVYHAMNRAVARLPLFEKEGDYAAFEQVLCEAHKQHPIRVFAYCLMPNHWHFVLWPKEDEDLTAFLRWLTHTHTMRWHAHHGTRGTGHLYQGRFKAIPIQTDEHFYSVARYVERNPVRAALVRTAIQWRWSSFWQREHGDGDVQNILARWPVSMPSDWPEIVNRAETEAELIALRQAVRRDRPFGGERWLTNTAVRLGLEYTLRPRGRPRLDG